jgi:hypothetical protein
MKISVACVMLLWVSCFPGEDRLPGLETSFQVNTHIFKNRDSSGLFESYEKMNKLLKEKKHEDSLTEVKIATENKRINDSVIWHDMELAFKRKKYEDSVLASQKSASIVQVDPNTQLVETNTQLVENDNTAMYEINPNNGEPFLDDDGEPIKKRNIKTFDYTTMLELAKYYFFEKIGEVKIYVYNYREHPSYHQAEIDGDILKIYHISVNCASGTYDEYQAESYVYGVEQPHVSIDSRTVAISRKSYQYYRCLEFKKRR